MSVSSTILNQALIARFGRATNLPRSSLSGQLDHSATDTAKLPKRSTRSTLGRVPFRSLHHQSLYNFFICLLPGPGEQLAQPKNPDNRRHYRIGSVAGLQCKAAGEKSSACYHSRSRFESRAICVVAPNMPAQRGPEGMMRGATNRRTKSPQRWYNSPIECGMQRPKQWNIFAQAQLSCGLLGRHWFGLTLPATPQDHVPAN